MFHLQPDIYAHVRLMMNRFNGTSAFPPPPTEEEKHRLGRLVPSAAQQPSDSAPCIVDAPVLTATKGVVSEGFADYVRLTLSRWGLHRFTYDWDGHFDDQYNQTGLQIFLKTLNQALPAAAYGTPLHAPVTDTLLSAVYYTHITKTLIPQYRAQHKNSNVLSNRRDAARVRKAQNEVCVC